MSGTFSIDIDWLARQTGNEIERVTLAGLTINLDGSVATELEDLNARAVRKAVWASAYDAALWFAGNWWRLICEPERRTSGWRMSHNLGAAGGGYLWPNLTFCSDGHTILVRSRATSRPDGEPIRYLQSFDVHIPIHEFERAIESFIESVIARLAGEKVGNTELCSLWTEVRAEHGDPTLSNWRRLEAIMGFDPDEAPASTIRELQDGAASYGASAVEEMAAASGEHAAEAMKELWDKFRPRAVSVTVANADRLRRLISEAMESQKLPWENGETAAKICRSQWSLSGPIKTKTLCDLLSISTETVLTRDHVVLPWSAGFRDVDSDQVDVILQSPRPENRRFALSRVIGDHLITQSSERLLPVTRMLTKRQKFQKAFAQELLCPYSLLDEFLSDKPLGEEAIEDAANNFDVSPLTIRTTLVNKGRLDRSELDV